MYKTLKYLQENITEQKPSKIIKLVSNKEMNNFSFVIDTSY